MADKDEILVAIESGAGLLDDGKETRWIKGVTRVRADSAVARKWPIFFLRDGASDDEIAAARAPIDAHVIAQTEKQDLEYRRDQERRYPPQPAIEQAAQVISAFRHGGRSYGAGELVAIDDPVVKKMPAMFQLPARPLAR
jgi:hypothetical protein